MAGLFCAIGRAVFSVVFTIFRVITLVILRLVGWRVEGGPPDTNKFVVIAAPHTSNWDFIFMLAVAVHFKLRLRWLGKSGLFKPPWGGFMRALGGIPVDRSSSNNVVAQTIDAFHAAEHFVVAVPPEGTRDKVRVWKTGFYNIAHGAGVPIALGFLDYKRKVGGIGGTFYTTGDYDADLAEIKAFYAKVTPKHDERHH